MKEKFVVVVDDEFGSYYRPFDHLGPLETNPAIIARHPERVALVVFTGGEDVSPDFYGEKPHITTHSNRKRDLRERIVFEEAVKQGLPIAGICRGSQLVCALSGGKLIQNINKHGGNHTVKTDEDETIVFSSTHHQMQLPPDDAKVVAWAEPRRSDIYCGAPGVFYDPPCEYEVVHYPRTKAVGMQYHPEYQARDSRGFQYCGYLMERFFGLR